MAKAWQRYSKRHGRYITRAWWTARRPRGLCWGGCSALLSLLSPRGIPSHAPEPERTGYRSAKSWKDAEETEGPCRGTAWLLSAYSVSGPAGRTQRRRAYGQVSPLRMHGDALRVLWSSTGAVQLWPELSPYTCTVQRAVPSFAPNARSPWPLSLPSRRAAKTLPKCFVAHQARYRSVVCS
jgi:hypothetical protein